MQMRGQFHALFTYHGAEMGGWVGHRANLDVMMKIKKKPLALPGIGPW